MRVPSCNAVTTVTVKDKSEAYSITYERADRHYFKTATVAGPSERCSHIARIRARLFTATFTLRLRYCVTK